MKFFKENSYEIVRLILNQIALAVFGIVLVFASRMSNDGDFGALSLCASIFSVLFYLYILYATMQELGSKHKIRVEGNRLKNDRLRGLKIMLFAQVPNFILLFLMFLGWLFAFVCGTGNAINAIGLNMFTITQLIMYFAQSMYDGIIGSYLPVVGNDGMQCLILFLSYLVSVLPGILVCWGSYILGMKDKKIFSRHKEDNDNPHS